MTPIVPTPSSAYANPSYPYHHQAQLPDNMNFDDQDSYGSPSDSNSAWGYTPSGPPIDRAHGFQNQPHPSLSSYNRNGVRNGMPGAAPGEPWQGQSSYRTDTDTTNYRNWPATDPSYPVLVNPQTSVYAAQEADPSIRHSEPTAQQSEANSWPQQPVASDSSVRYAQESFQGTGNSYDHPQVYGAPSQAPYYQGNYPQSSSSSPPATQHSLPRHSYTRTLVGPLSSNACRLLDEHRKPGIFFLFQDLSVRTEGVFSLPLKVSFYLTPCRDLPVAFTSNERRRVRRVITSDNRLVDTPFTDHQHQKWAQYEFILTSLRSLHKHSPNPSSFSQPSASQEYPVCSNHRFYFIQI